MPPKFGPFLAGDEFHDIAYHSSYASNCLSGISIAHCQGKDKDPKRLYVIKCPAKAKLT
jgi:hypothetical protein